MELWKDIKGYEGLYQVSTYGRVRSLDREIIIEEKNRTYTRTQKGRIININKKSLYKRVQLTKQDGRGKRFLIHRLVAEAFILNPDNKKQVNHKDLNPMNNHVDNLEWVTSSENVIHGHYTRKYQVKKVSLIKDEIIYHFNSINDAKRAGAVAVERLLKGTQKSTKGWSLPI